MAKGTCSIEGCTEKVRARGLCPKHYAAAYYRGEIGEHSLVNKPIGRLCSIEGCSRVVNAREICGTHYARWRKHGDAEMVGRSSRIQPVIDVGGTTSKRCTRCGEVKPLDQFYVLVEGSGGRTSRCVVCFRALQAVADRSWRFTDEWRAAQREDQARRRAADPERYRGYSRQRAARRKGASVCDLTDGEWAAIVAAYGRLCAYCGKPAEGQDHVVPLVRGGGHTASNVVPACRSCNSRKRTRTAEEWERAGGPRLRSPAPV